MELDYFRLSFRIIKVIYIHYEKHKQIEGKKLNNL